MARHSMPAWRKKDKKDRAGGEDAALTLELTVGSIGHRWNAPSWAFHCRPAKGITAIDSTAWGVRR